MTDEQLAPCPCCGSADTLVDNWPIPITPWQVYRSRCKECKLRTGDYSTPDDAIAAWNSRAPPSEPSEREERLWEALWRIKQWAEAYPTDIFPIPDAAYLRKAHEVLTANDMTLDRLSAHAMRHVVQGVGKIAKEALDE